MKAVFLNSTGKSEKVFEVKETPQPKAHKGAVGIKVEAFGLNFADVMARLGLYDDCPKLPTILGYDVVGTIDEVGEGVTNFAKGDRVIGLTRFGGYAQYAVADTRAIAKIPSSIDVNTATAMATQWTTAYYAAYEAVNIFSGDNVLVHAAAGGVGNGIVQLALLKGATLIATVGSDDKAALIKALGAQHVINYNKENYVEKIKELGLYKKIDLVYDSIAGSNIGKGFKMLNAGGKVVMYGASKLTDNSWNKLNVLKNALAFGIYHPAEFMMTSKSILGVNMLHIADNKPEIISRCMNAVVALYNEGKIKPIIGDTFGIDDLATAHNALQNRATVGKLAVKW
jgi:NADPH:quinone reductase-like Zn-dependent oxidoreductase